MRLCDLHPLTLLVYFASVIVITVMTRNPIVLSLALCGGVCGVKIIKKKCDLKYYLPLFIIVALLNPIFSHNGETILFFFRNQRVTLEATLFGVVSAMLIIATLYWCKLFSLVFGTDKLTWAVGALSPKLSVALTMALRFIPLFKSHAKSIYDAQLSMGVFDTSTLSGKLRMIKNVFSALLSLSMENAIETADTMRSRGFGKGKRTSYTLFRFSSLDLSLTLLFIFCDVMACILLPSGTFLYYPKIVAAEFNIKAILLYITCAILFLFPAINEAKEGFRWKYLISKI
ncbi:MAG: energy-coupling factor transporter transmembrane protein EcfT [Clostridia bacterium]|nr:energy-coupling factor transporter transmembrane protein EcfT [Clostridia bacterium]